MESITLSNITFYLGIIAIIFSVYHYFKNPQIGLEKRQALDQLEDSKNKLLTDKDLTAKADVLSQKEVESKANLLAQQVQWEKEANEKKFCELSRQLADNLALTQNHVHTLDTKIDVLTNSVVTMNLSLTNEITRLSTIIEERLPDKV
jgi:RNAse (barnase) inhibitor barstar